MPAIRSSSPSGSSQPPRAMNNNPKGKNQHKDCPPADDPRVPQLLAAYHRRGITDRKRLSRLLRDDHGILMSESTIARRKRELGLRASGRTTLELADAVKRQLVKDQMDKDQTGRIGAKTVKLRIFEETGIDLTRDWIRNEMRLLAPDEFESRRPRHKAPPKSGTQAHDEAQVASTSQIQNQNIVSNPQRQQQRPEQPGPHPVINVDSDSENENEPLRPLFFEPPHQPAGPSSEPFHPPSIPALPMPQRNPNANPHPNSHPNPHPNLHPHPHPHPNPTSNPPSISTILDILAHEAPKMVTLTRLLGSADLVQLREFGRTESGAYAEVVGYMEAAALLERQLARFASGLAEGRVDGVNTR